MWRVAIVLLVVLLLASGLVPHSKIYDDGLWSLSVTVRSTSGQPIKGISAEALLDVQSAEKVLANPPPVWLTQAEHSIYSAVQQPKADEPLKVNVPTSQKLYDAFLWTYRGRFFQYRGLLVVVEYQSGKLEARAIEIPDLRHTRDVSVEVP
jgi:hypothetical protein